MQNSEITIGEIVANDFRAAEVFKNAGIDFCCGGRKTLNNACKESGIDVESLKKELDQLILTEDTSHNFKEWELGFLCDYIVNTHHKFVLKKLPEIEQYTRKIASVHGNRHAELIEVADLFQKISLELLQHLKNEEEVLFPSIKENNTNRSKEIIRSEISRMTGEHDFAGTTMDKINKITNNYSVPADGCSTYRVAFSLLRQFEDDLHIHVHLENNILYPKAIQLTK